MSRTWTITDTTATNGTRDAGFIELGARVARATRIPTQAIGRAADVARWGQKIESLPHEELWVLLLNGKNRIVGERMVSRGGLNACAVKPHDILRAVVREAVGGFVLIHNHPSGDPAPSREDVAMTETVIEGARVLGLTLLDHVVVARDGHSSMLEAGLIS